MFYRFNLIVAACLNVQIHVKYESHISNIKIFRENWKKLIQFFFFYYFLIHQKMCQTQKQDFLSFSLRIRIRFFHN